PTRGDRASQRGDLPRRARGGGVLDRPATGLPRGRPALEQLDTRGGARGAGVSATREDLADDDVGRGASGGRDGERARGGHEHEEENGESSMHEGSDRGGKWTSFLIARCHFRRKG